MNSERQYTLDGDAVDMTEFLRANDFEPEEIAEIEALAVGEEIVYGGGAAAEFVLCRVA